MPISTSDALVKLIESLTPAEKRNFKAYSSRNQNHSELLFMELFDMIEHAKDFDEEELRCALDNMSKSKFSNLKRHLYSQILKSLRILSVSKKPNVQVRSLIDHAYILYDRGLYNEALKILKKAKLIADDYYFYNMHLIILEFEKKIESRHITRSGKDRAFDLVSESTILQKHIDHSVLLSNLRINLHGRYIESGHCKTAEDKMELKQFFQSSIEKVYYPTLGPVESVYYHQSFVWYHYILLEFNESLTCAEEWLKVLKNNPKLITKDVDNYFRAYHYILSSCYHLGHHEELIKYHEEIEAYRKMNYNKFNLLTKIISFMYVHSARLNRIILTGNFEEGPSVIDRSLKRIKRYQNKLDEHRILVFYFKIAWIYFGNEMYSQAIFYLNRIVNNELPKLREDLQIYARLLFLMCHYELRNYDVFEYSIRTFQSYFTLRKDHYPLQAIVQNCFLKMATSSPREHKTFMDVALHQINDMKMNPFHRVSLTYLDVRSWLLAKITGKTLSQVIVENAHSSY